MKNKKAAKQESLKIYIGLILRSKEAWGVLVSCKKSPSVSFKLMRYHRDVLDTLFRIIEEQRNDYIKEFAPQTDGLPAIDPKVNPEAYEKFVNAFSEYLKVETDLVQVDMTLADLVADLDKFEGNCLTEEILMLIDPFFKQ